MTTPTPKELAERLRLASPFCHKIEDCLHCELYDIAAALDAMPEADEEAKRWREAVHKAMSYAWGKDLNNDEQVRWQQFAQLWQSVVGFPWNPSGQPTPPQPERVSDEELDKLDEVYSRLIGDEADAVKRVLRELRARRQGEGEKR